MGTGEGERPPVAIVESVDDALAERPDLFVRIERRDEVLYVQRTEVDRNMIDYAAKRFVEPVREVEITKRHAELQRAAIKTIATLGLVIFIFTRAEPTPTNTIVSVVVLGAVAGGIDSIERLVKAIVEKLRAPKP